MLLHTVVKSGAVIYKWISMTARQAMVQRAAGSLYEGRLLACEMRGVW